MTVRVPLSYQQAWLWDLTQRYPQWSSVLGYAYCIFGDLDIDALNCALEKTSARHSSLRTAITLASGFPELEVVESRGVRFDVVNAAEEETQRLVVEFCEQTIDPTVWPLMTARLFTLSENKHVLALAVHRMIADCYGVDLMLGDLWSLYRAQDLTPPEAPQYGEYAVRQRNAHSQWLNRHQAYWHERLDGATVLRYPRDSNAETGQQGTLGMMNCFFGGELSANLHESARRVRTLSANVMLAIYVAVMARLSAQMDFIVPFNVAGRQSEHKHVVGYFSHILYLRMKLTGEETYTQLVSLVANEFFKALSHQDFGRLATEHPELSTGVYFQWATWYENDPSETSAKDSSEVTTSRLQVREFGEGITALPPGMVDLEITFFDTAEGIHTRGVYRSDLFTAASMERLLLALRLSAEQFVSDPSVRFMDLADRDLGCACFQRTV